MIADSFDSRTFANMKIALERACKILPTGAEEEHWARRHIASKIVECAGGDKTLRGMTEAGRAAAHELCATFNEPYAISSRNRARLLIMKE
jgi:hypothetical protein